MSSTEGALAATPVDNKAINNTPTIWYLAYGSNMDPKVLTGRRKIQPIESRPVIVPNYWLSFDIGGIPFIEPCFASILKMDSSRLHEKAYALHVHSRTQHGREFLWDESHPDHPQRSYPPVLQGVVHRITLRDWQLVIQSEGGWGYDVPTGYNQIEVDCVVVGSKEHLSAHVLEARPLSVKTHCQPTARYKSLLTAGAAHHSLDPAYQRYLAGIVPYECTGLRSRIARSIFTVVSSPLMIMFAIMFWRNKGKSADQLKRPPYWAAWCFDRAARFSGGMHDYLIAPIFGSGRRSSPAHQAIVRRRIQDTMEEAKSLGQLQQQREVEVEKESKALKMAEKAVESVAE
ncbi:hypothetical protein BC939DRAFT_456021 [Gamsiella multidivaricata]|uniref:uncharacterized protein n=1 Tax=Gamsiella multidivaricata TaxID=101098 RepID=UPI002220F0EB|nr:uncharacterized protein BC939DRAFT_456021 [Gamsiella multidivaricata]KAG0355646.1 hypothetical protein BGZ54_001061 [Gamsiella multidivaricata]KAI7821185.1 hypothetical protein BC939DRAFT_456021 [Gamsiella multidivaricata]